MYSVLLVDDEPLILSGIKFLLDWPKNDCEIIDTARNGQVALEKIRALQPNIVLCDINMPVMSGMDLLQAVAQELPQIVFVMLTNLQDFDLAQAALRSRAVDYVLKSQLEPEALERSLKNAKTEFDNRRSLAAATQQALQTHVTEAQMLKDAFLQVDKTLPVAELPQVLRTGDALLCYGAVLLTLDYTSVPNDAQKTDEGLAELFAWETDMAAGLAQTHFSDFALFEPDGGRECLVLLCWRIAPQAWEDKLRSFYTKLCSASANITRATPCLLASDTFAGVERLADCRKQLFSLLDYYYNTSVSPVFAAKCPPLSYRPLGLTGISGRLADEIRAKNTVGCEAVLDRAQEHVSTIVHEKSQSAWLCGELYTAASTTLKSIVPANRLIPYFEHATQAHRQIARLRTRGDTVAWLSQLRTFVVASVEQFSQSRSDFVEKAKQYVEEHLESRIMLSDVADHVNISPAYLSSLYKKTHKQNFVDYINSRKMDRACEMLRTGDFRIYEISYRLGFENAYYFTRVFKRFIGMKPTEYQRKVQPNAAITPEDEDACNCGAQDARDL